MFLPFKAIRNKKGFTLVELIVVMAVLAIISAIAVPRFLGVQEKAKEDADYSTGVMIAKAAELYHAKNQVADTITVGDLITGSYMNNIDFQSKLFEDYTKDTIYVTITEEGVITVDGKLLETSTPLPLYPRPADTTPES